MKVRRNLLIALSLLSLSANAQRIKGSDTVLPVAQQTAERFMNQHPDARVTVTGGGTGVGISALMDNTTDIAMASRPIKFSEKMKLKAAKQEVEEVIIAYDALAVIVNPSNPVSQLTRQQLEAIFRGIRPAVVALIAAPTFSLAKSAGITITNCWIPIVSALLIWQIGVNPIFIIIAAGLGGYLYGKLLKPTE